MNKLSVAEVKAIIPQSLGSINWMADTLGCSWDTVRKFINKHPTLKKMHEEASAQVLAKARDNVLNAIQLGDIQTTRWYLGTRDPEYKQKVEVDYI
jgi:hypothetical protein